MAMPSLTFLPLSAGRDLVSAPFDEAAALSLTTAAEDAMELFGKDHEYTKLIIKHENVDPDDVYSQVAYEKGFHFLYYLDGLVGRQNFDKFIPHYFSKWAEKSLDSFEFKETFLEFFNGLGDEEVKQKVATIDWDDKFYTPGLPPKPKFNTELADMCYDLAAKWQDNVSEVSIVALFALVLTAKLVVRAYHG